MGTLQNKIILVTGAALGIGAATALKLSDEGATVIVNYVGSQIEADKLVGEIQQKGGEAMAVRADISQSKEVQRLFDIVIKKYGRIDVLVNNAGIMIIKLIKDTTDEDFTRQFDINVRGTFNTLREAVTRLADNGSIINLSSTTTRLLMSTLGTYVATKGAVEQLTRVLAKEVATRGINVNVVSPGPAKTESFIKDKSKELLDYLASLNAFNRLSEPGDIARVICFLASDEAKWISGQNIGVNGAMA